MAKIIIKNLQNRVIPINDESKSLLDGILENGQDWMHACGGNGRCTTCAYTIVALEGSMNDLSEVEEKFRNMGKLGEKHRLACQSKLQGTLTVTVPERNQLPHLTYGE